MQIGWDFRAKLGAESSVVPLRGSSSLHEGRQVGRNGFECENELSGLKMVSRAFEKNTFVKSQTLRFFFAENGRGRHTRRDARHLARPDHQRQRVEAQTAGEHERRPAE